MHDDPETSDADRRRNDLRYRVGLIASVLKATGSISPDAEPVSAARVAIERLVELVTADEQSQQAKG